MCVGSWSRVLIQDIRISCCGFRGTCHDGCVLSDKFVFKMVPEMKLSTTDRFQTWIQLQSTLGQDDEDEEGVEGEGGVGQMASLSSGMHKYICINISLCVSVWVGGWLCGLCCVMTFAYEMNIIIVILELRIYTHTDTDTHTHTQST